MTPACGRGVYCCRDETADLSLGHGDEGEQRLGRHTPGRVLLLDREIADLWAVAVHDRQAPPLVEELEQAPCHRCRLGRLLLVCAKLPSTVSAFPPRATTATLVKRPTLLR
jgi:hypothetical protein